MTQTNPVTHNNIKHSLRERGGILPLFNLPHRLRKMIRPPIHQIIPIHRRKNHIPQSPPFNCLGGVFWLVWV